MSRKKIKWKMLLKSIQELKFDFIKNSGICVVSTPPSSKIFADFRFTDSENWYPGFSAILNPKLTSALLFEAFYKALLPWSCQHLPR